MPSTRRVTYTFDLSLTQALSILDLVPLDQQVDFQDKIIQRFSPIYRGDFIVSVAPRNLAPIRGAYLNEARGAKALCVRDVWYPRVSARRGRVAWPQFIAVDPQSGEVVVSDEWSSRGFARLKRAEHNETQFIITSPRNEPED